MNKKKLICPYPFGRVALSKKFFNPCCGAWVKDTQLNQESEDLWNGEVAQVFRASILDGSFKFCRRELCQEPLIDISGLSGDLVSENYFVQAENIKAINEQSLIMPNGPGLISMGSSDKSCNLKCPSCRTELITKMSKKRHQQFIQQLEILKRFKNSIRIIRFGDNGEVFFSNPLKRLLKICTPKVFPQLEGIIILTNGTLLTPKIWQSCRPGTDWIREINVSIDAGNESDYAKVRGGNWKNLLKNLDFMAQLKSSGQINRLYLNTTLQLHNFQSLNELIDLGAKLNADSIIAHPYSQWSHITSNQYLANAVHLPGHQYYPEYVQQIEQAKIYARGKIRLEFKLPSSIA